MALSDFAVRQAKTTGKTYTLSDIDGLSLIVFPTGGKSWCFRYYWMGKQKRMSLGTYPEIGLRDARGLRDEARALVAKSINPNTHRKHKHQALRLGTEYTVAAVYYRWLEHRKLELKEGRQSTLSQIQRVFKKDVLPQLGDMSIHDIRRPDLLVIIAKIEQRKAFTMAEKVRTWLRQMFCFAMVVVNNLETNPASDLDVVAVPIPPVVHNPFLCLPELPALLHRLHQYGGRMATSLGIRLMMMVTALCTDDEIAGMVHAFYAKVRRDDMLGPIFNAHIDDWDHHLAHLVDFWSSILLRTGRFKGPPMPKHIALPGLTAELFQRWLMLFHETTSAQSNQAMGEQAYVMAQRIAQSLWYGYQLSHHPDQSPTEIVN